MNSLSKKLEVLANVAVLVVAILIATVLVKQFLLPRPAGSGPAANARIQPGMKLSLPGADWSRSDKTLVMVLSTQCHFCTDSAPFYQRLAQEQSRRGGARLVAVMPQSVGEAQKYLGDHGVTVDEVLQATPDVLGASGTPTLIMLDSAGSVVDAWVGKLPPEKESEVIDRLLAG
jgi:hypothetical protein